mmetsp:Transcript_21698/g.49116  ORF Transcript_21698/g.49116 Transcript_21698/m.49116 type:complete len:211 (+) Transcript_21698:572-1204(+)
MRAQRGQQQQQGQGQEKQQGQQRQHGKEQQQAQRQKQQQGRPFKGELSGNYRARKAKEEQESHGDTVSTQSVDSNFAMHHIYRRRRTAHTEVGGIIEEFEYRNVSNRWGPLSTPSPVSPSILSPSNIRFSPSVSPSNSRFSPSSSSYSPYFNPRIFSPSTYSPRIFSPSFSPIQKPIHQTNPIHPSDGREAETGEGTGTSVCVGVGVGVV